MLVALLFVFRQLVKQPFCFIVPDGWFDAVGLHDLCDSEGGAHFKVWWRGLNATRRTRTGRLLDDRVEGFWYSSTGDEYSLPYVCKDDWTGTLHYEKDCKSYDAARDACADMGRTLVAITSQSMNDEVVDLVGDDSVWIGIYKLEGTETWVTEYGSLVVYDNWAIGQPEPYWDGHDTAYMNNERLDEMCLDDEGDIWVVVFLVVGVFSVGATYWTIVCCWAMNYKHNVTDKRPPFQDVPSGSPLQQWMQDNIFSCCLYGNDTCLFACCCLPIRAADTYASVGASTYWCVFATWILAEIIGDIVESFFLMMGISGVGLWAGAAIFGCFMASNRGSLKRKMNMPAGDFCADFCLWCCCSCCVAIQEAHQVDRAMGAKVSCPFTLTVAQRQAWASQPAMGAGPIVVGAVVHTGPGGTPIQAAVPQAVVMHAGPASNSQREEDNPNFKR